MQRANDFMRMTLLPALLAGTLLAGCGEKKPAQVEPVPVTSVEQQNREIAERLAAQKAENEARAAKEGEAAERARFVNLIQEPVKRWAAAYDKMTGKNFREIDPMLAEMQAARNDISAAPVSACTGSKRDGIVAGMDQVATVFNEFKAAKGEQSDAGKRAADASLGIYSNFDALESCR
jgi:hypothetical protein